MRFEIKKTGFTKVLPGLFFAVIGSTGVAVIHFFPEILNQIPACMFREFFNIPCPACGATHSGIHLAHLNIPAALLANPFFFMVYILIFLWSLNALAGLLFKKNIQIVLSLKEQTILYRLVLVSFPLNWLFLILISIFTGRNGQ